jgi:epoxyqueuosine reductase
VPADTLDRELAREVERLGRGAGLDAVGIAPATPLIRARRALEQRKAAGLHAGMAFTYRNPARSTTPSRALPGVRAIVVGAQRYSAVPPPRPEASGPLGRVARYSWRDHYAELRRALDVVAAHLRDRGHRALVLVDDNALVDRETAYRAGIGWFGKNANLLLPGRGSWFVLGSVLTTAPLPAGAHVTPDGCGTCHRCLDACPTGAIIAPGVVDAGRCLAWLVQKPGTFPRAHREALGDRIYGCDDCQEVCPPNLRADRREASRLDRDVSRDVPADVPADAPVAEAWVPLLGLLEADDAALLARHGRWYIAQRDPRWLRRNALIALGNVGDPDDTTVVAALRRHLRHSDPTLRAHAVWAVRRLGREDLLDGLDDRAPAVADELAQPPPAPRAGRSGVLTRPGPAGGR